MHKLNAQNTSQAINETPTSGANNIIPNDDAIGVEGIGGGAELNRAGVGLGCLGGKAQETSRRTNGNHEQTRRHGVEGAGMADAALAQNAAQLRYDVVARPTRRFVDENDAASPGHPRRGVVE